jgi:hypothetical protein
MTAKMTAKMTANIKAIGPDEVTLRMFTCGSSFGMGFCEVKSPVRASTDPAQP